MEFEKLQSQAVSPNATTFCGPHWQASISEIKYADFAN